jgi:phosphosulfolactate synthase
MAERPRMTDMHQLSLPPRDQKPRTRGLTTVIDGGIPTARFDDIMTSFAQHIDFVKFGWGTALVTPDLTRKIAAATGNGVNFHFGGTLFEKFLLQNRIDEYKRFLSSHGATFVEISNGTIDLDEEGKAAHVADFSKDFTVIAEVGMKDQVKSELMAPVVWITAIKRDLEAGAHLVTLETRESGRGGLCRPNGELRFGLVEEILTAGLDHDRLIFEAPTQDLQSYFIKRVGPGVNFGNVAADDVVGLETLRLGLRSDTLIELDHSTKE